MLSYLLIGLPLGFYAALSPGPFQAFLLSQSLKKGWKSTLPAAFAPLLSDGPIVTLVLLILTQTPAGFLTALRIIGGVFVLYLGWRAFGDIQKTDVFLSPTETSKQQNLWQAVLMNALSPNPYIFWSLVAGPILLEGWRQSPALGVGFLLGFYGMLVGGFAALIIIFATARHLGEKVTRTLGIVSAVALALFGFYQIWMGILELIRVVAQ